VSAHFSDTSRPPGRQSAAALVNTLLPVISVALTVGLIVSLVIIGNFAPGGASAAMPLAAGTDHAAAPAAAGKKVTVEIEEGDMYIKPSSIDVPAGADVTVHVTNKGAQQHTLALQGADAPLIEPGASATMHWGVLSQSTQAWCVVAGHKDAGMLLNINVAGSAATPAPAAAAAGTSGAVIDPNAKPAADWAPHDPTLPPADGNTVHNATFRVSEQTMDVAPGVGQVRWTYNGTAPGPILHGKVGDVFTIHVVNDGSMAHSIDFHASKVAPNVQMRMIKPHESLDYTFTAQFAGTFTYHCGADPMIYHMGNGMFGAVVIDPPDLDKVDQELVLVQSELYLGPKGQPGDLKKMLAGTDDAVVFNGYYNQYAYAPIKVKPGSRIRVWLDNAGPNEDMAFHTVGTIFDTVWKEGHYELKADNPDHGGSQTLDLQPTQGGFVEFTLPDAGTYPFISHKMMNMSHGALGLFQVG
jgi:nitrite reductase (NO-forming)